MLKKLLILCIAIAPMAAVAQNQIAVVNSDEIIISMPELSEIERQLADKVQSLQRTLQELENQYNRLMAEIQALPETTSEAIIQDRQRELMQVFERHQTFQQNSQRELQQLQDDLFEPVQRRVLDAIQAVADEAGYLLVFDVNSPVFVSTNAPDITARVRTRLGI